MNLFAIERFEESHVMQLLRNNVEWITLVPFAWQPKHNSPELHLATGGHYYWSEIDSGIVQITTLAKARGMHIMLKPHIWLRGLGDGTWRSDLAMESQEDWEQWFENYRKFIVHYAQLAEDLGIELLCIGTELHQTVTKRQNDWHALIAEIRGLYRGKLTYAANWAKEINDVPFWAELDFIGVQAYFPLTDKANPTVDELVKGWKRHLTSLEEIYSKYQKPVLFTEIGFKSTSDAAVRPWEWSGGWSSSLLNKVSTQTQANCYESFFRVLWDQEWWAGAHIWKWYANLEDTRGMTEVDFTPQNKPAQNIMAQWYGKALAH